jgi:1,2-beta-oligoglucan phosphorylase
VNTVRGWLLGVREAFGDVVFDPVLPGSLDGLTALLTLLGRTVELRYRVRQANFGPSAIIVNGVQVPETVREENPYRLGGWRVPRQVLGPLLGSDRSVLEIFL